MRVFHFRLILVLCVFAAAVACSSDGTDVVDPPEDPVALGWSAFEAGDFAEAQTQFSAAIAQDATNADAYNGLGWTFLATAQLSSALQQFDAAVSNGVSGAAAQAGRSISLRDIEPVDYDAVVVAANAALTIDDDFVFAYDTSFDWHDVLLLVAQAHFALGAYGDASTAVTSLGGDGQDSQSPTYVADLLTEIDRLSSLFSN